MLRVEALRARQGDCLLLFHGDPERPRVTLIDGGPSAVWANTLEARLADLAEERAPDRLSLGLVMVSHIDDDHIEGIIRLTKRLLEEQDADDALLDVEVLWHNSFDDLVGGALPAEAEAAPAEPSTGPAPSLWEQQLALAEGADTQGAALPASVGQGRKLRDNAADLALDVNTPFDGMVRADADDPVVRLPEGLTITVLGPTQAQLDELQGEWDKQLPKPGTAGAAAYLDDSFSNLASIVALVQAEGRTLLLTGDARGDDIIENVRAADLLDAGGRLPLDLLKLPHHGSDRNVDVDFFQTFPADHYIVSGDGSNGNPEVDTFRMLFEARSEDTKPFTIHLTYDPADYRAYRRKRGEPPEPYPVDRLLNLFADQEAAGRDFTVVFPGPEEDSVAIDFATPHLSSPEPPTRKDHSMDYTPLEAIDPRDAFSVTPTPEEASAAASQAALLLSARAGVLGVGDEIEEEASEAGAAGFEIPDLRPLERSRRLRVDEATEPLGISAKELEEQPAPSLQDEMARTVNDLYEQPSTEGAAALFEAAMYSPSQLVQVAAAAGARETTRLRKQIRQILEAGCVSDDPLVARVATEALSQIDPKDPSVTGLVIPQPSSEPRDRVSETAVITHGTFASDAAWYRPGGDFYETLDANRPDLVVHDESFTWSGAYSDTARRADALLLKQWIGDQGLVEPDFFAHSHGGTVANLATKQGVEFDRLVLLAWPVHRRWFPAFERVKRIVDVRVRFDLVILVDRGGQRFRTNDFEIEEHRNGWFDHAAPHEPDYWDDHGLWNII